MARLNNWGFLGVAVVFHLIYIFSIFDIYFVSPIVSGMEAYSVRQSTGQEAPARRLVLFVGDGLRADKAFQSFPDPSPPSPNAPDALTPRPLAPFLRSRVLEHGTFGVSHTRMPTESRPGHVALIAGLYEDVSAVTTGWKLNPVNFDSIFNRSRHTWSWGSPDILPMFQHGAIPGRVDADCYSEEAEDYSKDAKQLDMWVFEKVKNMFALAETNSTLDTALRQDQNVLFLHLLGLDMAGHAYRPFSKEYLDNIKVVDLGVKEITQIVEDFYGDGKTAFVFTADHGMSDWGSHGDGHPDNTRTPLIVWGSGVAKPNNTFEGKAPGHDDGFSADWGLDNIERHDVAQADIAALMAYLVGLAFPVNSVGELPLSYLSSNPKEKAEAALINARGVLEMYRVKEAQKRSTELRYKPYPPLGDEHHSLEYRVNNIRHMIEGGDYENAIKSSRALLHVGLDGLRYLQTYDWLFLRVLVSLGYTGWIAFAATRVIDLHVLQGQPETSRNLFSSSLFGFASLCIFSMLILRKAPSTYYAYAVFPVIFWEEVMARRKALQLAKSALFGHIQTRRQAVMLLLQVFAFFGFLEALVLSYFQREIYTICFLAAALWPASYGYSFYAQNQLLIIMWWISCTSMSVFTLLPVVKVESTTLILIGGSLMLLVAILYLVFEPKIIPPPTDRNQTSTRLDSVSRSILGVQAGLIMLAMIVTRSSIASLQARQGLSIGNQVLGWLVLITSLSIPFLYRSQPNDHYLHRLVIIFLTFAPTFIILTISYESLFYVSFCALLVTWVRLEHQIHKHTTPAVKPLASPTSAATKTLIPNLSSKLSNPASPIHRTLSLPDLRIALTFLYLLQSAFFSTGNIASISSFSLDSVYRLLPIFNPFSQGSLLILKILIPFAFLSAVLGVLNKGLGLGSGALFMCVMGLGDWLALHFFWMVRDEGSWLDIGTSISHFVVVSLLGVFCAVLEGGSGVLVGGVGMGEDGGGMQGTVDGEGSVGGEVGEGEEGRNVESEPEKEEVGNGGKCSR